MAANSDLILAGVAGGGTGGTTLCWVAPTGTVAPTDASTAPGTGWLDAGWVSTNGLVVKTTDSTKDVQAFGTLQPVRTLLTGSSQTFDIGFLESNPVSLAVYNRKPLGSLVPVAGTGAFDFTTGAQSSERLAVIFDIVDGLNHIRAYSSDVQVTNRADLTVQAGTEIEYGVTMTSYPGPDGAAIHWFYVLNAMK